MVLPLSFILTLVIFQLSNHISKCAIFIHLTISFVSFFAIHAAFLHPNRAAIGIYFRHILRYYDENYEGALAKRAIIPLISMFCYPVNTIFFTMAELWGIVAVQVLLSNNLFFFNYQNIS